MYGNKQTRINNGTQSSADRLPLPLIEAVTGDVILASRSAEDLPRVGLAVPEGFEIVGEPVKIQLFTDFPSDEVNGLNLADTRKLLKSKLAEDADLHFGLGNKNQNWANLQFYAPTAVTV